MGTEEQNETRISEKHEIIDFLYIDKERIDSYVSQIRNGTLRSVVKKQGVSEETLTNGKVNSAVLSGGREYSRGSAEEASEQYDPCHSQIVQLLNDLGIVPLDQLPAKCDGELVMLNANIAIRDIASVKSIMPFFLKHSKTFGLPTWKNDQSMLKVMNEIILQLPDFIGLSVYFDGIQINGTLNARNLTIKHTDIVSNYGTRLPGEWYVLGILDSALEIENMEDKGIDSIDSIIDAYTGAMKSLCSSSVYKIIPILIFRQIKY